jgi:hypothetical protein
MIPARIEGIAVGPSRLLGIVQMFPREYYSGHYTSVDQLAVRRDAKSPWEPRYAHLTHQLNLQGEQPEVLLISESHGKKVVYAAGHDRVLELFSRRGEVWAVTEGCVGHFDPGKDGWNKVLETDYRFYWKATAALDDGRHLWIGSDRGFVSRLDLATNRCENLTVLKDREIVRIAKDSAGRIVVTSRAAAQGCLPVQLKGKVEPIDSDTVTFDGQHWKPLETAPPIPEIRPTWSSENDSNFLFRFDKEKGESLPEIYATGVFRIRILAASPDEKRIWLRTYSGLARLDN